MESVGVGLLGLGTVGTAVARRLINEWGLLGERAAQVEQRPSAWPNQSPTADDHVKVRRHHIQSSRSFWCWERSFWQVTSRGCSGFARQQVSAQGTLIVSVGGRVERALAVIEQSHRLIEDETLVILGLEVSGERGLVDELLVDEVDASFFHRTMRLVH